MTSFVFAPYLTGVVARTARQAHSAAKRLAISLFVAGFCVAAIAPVTGQRSDAGGRRKRNLTIWSALVIASTVGLFFVRDDYRYLCSAVLLAAGSAFLEFAQVSYNAMLQQISNPSNVGRISGLGWGSGYLGGIVVMLLSFVLFIQPEVGLFGVTAEGGLKYRALALVVAVWFAFWSIPIFLAVPEDPADSGNPEGQLPGVLSSARTRRAGAVPFRSPCGVVPARQCSPSGRPGCDASFRAVLAVSVYGRVLPTS